MEPKPVYCDQDDIWEGSDKENVAIGAYMHYVDAVGGTTWDGKPIPEWHQIKGRQRNGWRAAMTGGLQTWLKQEHARLVPMTRKDAG